MSDILNKLKENKIVGRGGAGFPAHIKWETAKKTEADKKYVICNASEGEMGVFKDYYILENFPEKVFRGMEIAMKFLETNEGYLNINSNYWAKLEKKLTPLIQDSKSRGFEIHVFREHPSYIGGEASTILNSIENGMTQPKVRKYRTTERGLFEKPTLIHNVETLYDVADVEAGEYEGNRFYCIEGFGELKDSIKKTVVHLPAEWSILKILEKTNTLPEDSFFVQIGGGASGEIYNINQLEDVKMSGAGSIEIYDVRTTTPLQILQNWFRFYKDESCGKCTPCREGSFHLHELVKDLKEGDPIPWDEINKIVKVMGEASFCGLGTSILPPVSMYIKNILKKDK